MFTQRIIGFKAWRDWTFAFSSGLYIIYDLLEALEGKVMPSISLESVCQIQDGTKAFWLSDDGLFPLYHALLWWSVRDSQAQAQRLSVSLNIIR